MVLKLFTNIKKNDLRSFMQCDPTDRFLIPSSSTASKSSNSSQSIVNRFSTKNPLDFLDHRTAKGFRAVPGFKRSITFKMDNFL